MELRDGVETDSSMEKVDILHRKVMIINNWDIFVLPNGGRWNGLTLALDAVYSSFDGQCDSKYVVWNKGFFQKDQTYALNIPFSNILDVRRRLAHQVTMRHINK